MQKHKVGYLIGSLARESVNRKLAKALVRLAPSHLEMTEISFKDLPLYSYDHDADFPPVARTFKNELAAVDAVLFVTPEYNRSIPGGLKNAIDWATGAFIPPPPGSARHCPLPLRTRRASCAPVRVPTGSRHSAAA